MDHADLACPDPPYAAVPARRRLLAPAPPAPSGEGLTRAELWALVAPYRGRLIAVARRRGLSLQDAQDVAHNVLCAAVECAHLDAARVESFLVRLTVTRCRELEGDAARRAAMLARSRGDDRLVGHVEDAVCDEAHARWLLARLPARERSVIELSVAGETVTGIASATGLSYPTVDRLLSRARKEMRRLAGVLGLAGALAWRHRRLVAAPAAVAVAGVSALTLQPAPAVSVPVARPAVEVRSVLPRARAAVVRAPAVAPPRRVVTPRVGLAAPVRVRPDAAAAPVRRRVLVDVVAPNAKHGDDKALVQRVAQCLREGVELELGARGGIVCAGDVHIVLPKVARP
ncbi:MAG TPA: sigma-70 family RNA polymerase sigma factor [Frankiaceae bacterium]|nr:sigma-70 family RNA polymerase sigma factor [Frankiaceae bacterium]